MTKSVTRYEQLKVELEKLKVLADKEAHLYQSSRDLLYEGLGRVYLWWMEASEEYGLLERLYDEYDIQYKRVTKNEVNFSPVLRYLWNMNAGVNSATIWQWNNALNGLHTAIQDNKEYFKTNTLNKIISRISNGGIKGLTVKEEPNDDDPSAGQEPVINFVFEA